MAGTKFPAANPVPATFLQAGAPLFWLAALGTGIGAGVGAIILTRLLEIGQHVVWAGSGTHILEAAAEAGAWRHVTVLLGAGVFVGIGQLVLVRLTSGNGIDITSAIWFSAGRLPVVRTFIAFPAGIAKMPQLRFHLYTFAGSWPW